MANKTFAQRWRRLTAEEQRAYGGMTHAATLLHGDLTEAVADTDMTFTGPISKVGTYVEKAGLVLKTPFEDASDAALDDTKVSIGNGSNTNEHGGAWQVNENGTEVLADVDSTPYTYLAADTIDILVESMTAKSLVNIDTGEALLLVAIADLDDLETAGNNA